MKPTYRALHERAAVTDKFDWECGKTMFCEYLSWRRSVERMDSRSISFGNYFVFPISLSGGVKTENVGNVTLLDSNGVLPTSSSPLTDCRRGSGSAILGIGKKKQRAARERNSWTCGASSIWTSLDPPHQHNFTLSINRLEAPSRAFRKCLEIEIASTRPVGLVAAKIVVGGCSGIWSQTY